jgi:hypothetical protein
MASTKTPDKVDAAIAGVKEVPNVTCEFRLSSGRGAAILVPGNLTPQEALDLISAITRELPTALVQAAMQRGARALEVPGGLHVVPPA